MRGLLIAVVSLALMPGCRSQRSVDDVLAKYGAKSDAKFKPLVGKEDYPPERLTLIALKEERRVEVWMETAKGLKFLTEYPITAASGVPGPKRKEGDLQVPEGFYRLTDLNPNSRYHLSVRIDYPNKDDIARSKIPVSEMGGDIFLHGRAVSIGCIAIGDSAIEELFCLIARAKRREIWIAPYDFRKRRPPANDELYQRLAKRMASYRR